MRLLRNTNSRRNTGSCAVPSLTSADSVCNRFCENRSGVSPPRLEVSRSAITPRLAAPTAPSKASSHRPPARPRCAPAHLNLDLPAELAWWRDHLHADAATGPGATAAMERKPGRVLAPARRNHLVAHRMHATWHALRARLESWRRFCETPSVRCRGSLLSCRDRRRARGVCP